MFPSYHKLDPRETAKDVEECLLCEERDVRIKRWFRFNWLLHTYDFNISKVPVKSKKYNDHVKKNNSHVTQTLETQFLFYSFVWQVVAREMIGAFSYIYMQDLNLCFCHCSIQILTVKILWSGMLACILITKYDLYDPASDRNNL